MFSRISAEETPLLCVAHLWTPANSAPWTPFARFASPHQCTLSFRLSHAAPARPSDARLDLQQSERSGQTERRISCEQLRVVACGWAPAVCVSPAAPNHWRQWHHTVSGLSAETMRRPPPGVRAPVRVSDLFLCVDGCAGSSSLFAPRLAFRF